jgi:hypothetical protein
MLRMTTTVVPALALALLIASCDGDNTKNDDGGGAAGTPPGDGGGGGNETSAGAGGVDTHGGAGGAENGLAGAGGDNASGASDGGTSAGAGEAGSHAVGGAPAGEGGAGGTPSAGCTTGDEAHAVFDENGGLLELCGAEVTMPPGVLAEPRTLTLSIVSQPPGVPQSLAAGGPAFEVEIEGDLPATESAPFYVIVPHVETSRYVYLYVHAGGAWNYVEACTREADRIGQEAWSEGVFVTLVETEDFPASVTGLGSGTVDVTFDEVANSFDLDSGAIETHAIYDSTGDGRTVTLSATKEAADSSLERLRIDLGIDNDGNASLIQVTYGSTADAEGFWSYLPFFPQAAQVELTRDQGGELTGSLSTELTRGETLSPFSASFDVVVERYRYPPEGYCNLPEGDPRQPEP